MNVIPCFTLASFTDLFHLPPGAEQGALGAMNTSALSNSSSHAGLRQLITHHSPVAWTGCCHRRRSLTRSSE